MTEDAVEQALARALAYLRLSGVPVTREVHRRVLNLLNELLAASEQDLVGRAMDELPRHFELSNPPAPRPMPALRRVSIRYGDPS